MSRHLNFKKFIPRVVLPLLSLGLAALIFSLLSSNTEKLDLQPQLSTEDLVKIEATPKTFNPEKGLVIELDIETYADPDFMKENLPDIVLLEDNTGKPYVPKWVCTSSSATHKHGSLTFPIQARPKTIKLTIYRLEPVIFEWRLKPVS
ncbi:MAG: hypothetical protein AB7F28_03855 [Candidatus Margulisiibacteriota bacterium]